MSRDKKSIKIDPLKYGNDKRPTDVPTATKEQKEPRPSKVLNVGSPKY
jgi:hypothetical protein